VTHLRVAAVYIFHAYRVQIPLFGHILAEQVLASFRAVYADQLRNINLHMSHFQTFSAHTLSVLQACIRPILDHRQFPLIAPAPYHARYPCQSPSPPSIGPPLLFVSFHDLQASLTAIYCSSVSQSPSPTR
jgi:hypothetical protein